MVLAIASNQIPAVDSPGLTVRSGSSWQRIVEPVEPFLVSVAKSLEEQVDAFDSEVVPYARYAMANRGKQLRPALVALAGNAVGTLNDGAVKVAVIIEMIHLATLVHDDIMDEASIRRRRPTLAANWGNQISVLVGDCLFARALELAASFPTSEVCRAVSSATSTVCSGEIRQTMHRREFKLNRAQYFKILGMKTGELFAQSCDLGSWLCGATPVQRAALREYGLALGTAYQLYDDCVDLFGNEAGAGKSLGTDLATGKLTLPLIEVMERAKPADKQRLEAMLTQWKPEYAAQIVQLCEEYNAFEASRGVLRQILAEAVDCLKVVPASPNREALSDLAQFLSQQTDALGVSKR